MPFKRGLTSPLCSTIGNVLRSVAPKNLCTEYQSAKVWKSPQYANFAYSSFISVNTTGTATLTRFHTSYVLNPGLPRVSRLSTLRKVNFNFLIHAGACPDWGIDRRLRELSASISGGLGDASVQSRVGVCTTFSR